MTLPIRTLPVDQRWDCHGCGTCCRGNVIPLGGEELRRLRQQGWGEHPEYRGVRVAERRGTWSRRYRLAKRRDESCVFLMPDGRCRIHHEHGAAAKPLVCRMFPFQLVPLGDFAYFTVRRSCPSAAADRGSELEKHRRQVRQLAEQMQMAARPVQPPAIAGAHRRPWSDTLPVFDAFGRLMLDDRYPIVRRLAHGLALCDLLSACRLRKLQSRELAELLSMLEVSAVEEAGALFCDRTSPGKAARLLFRQTAWEHLRLHPNLVVEQSWREPWRSIVTAIALARGKGRLPRVHPELPETTFEALEGALGPLDPQVLRPLTAYFEAAASSGQYVMLGRRGWSIVDGFRALALSYPVALWMLRLFSTGRPPEVDDMIGLVAAIDRGQGHAPLAGARYRRRVASLAGLGELGRLVAWYAR